MHIILSSKCTSLFEIINKYQTKQYICEQNKYRSIRNSNQLNKNSTKKQSKKTITNTATQQDTRYRTIE